MTDTSFENEILNIWNTHFWKCQHCFEKTYLSPDNSDGKWYESLCQSGKKAYLEVLSVINSQYHETPNFDG